MSQNSRNAEGIAIVGMAGRFPKARNLDEFWSNLCNGVEAISFFTDEELAATGSAPARHPNFVRARGVLEGADLFDAAFFGMKPKEAEITDPQHRLFLECASEALEDANCDPDKFNGAIGVFAGMSMNTYLANNLLRSPELLIGINGEAQAIIGNDKDFLTTRVSYKLNLKGPSLNIQTACSTSLVAVCVACQHLLNHQCDVALAGAVSVSFPQKRGYVYQEGGITSPDGHCRAFDSKAAGTVAGEGVGIVALKRLEDALADGDSIYAVIKGFAMNNDGGVKIGYTAPSIEGQAEAIMTAQAMAGVAPETISYIEAHGTGTPLGDPIEIEGLSRAFLAGTEKKNFCAIGTVKSNIGHLDTAAGIAGLIKAVLALREKKIPPSLHFETPNPKIDFANSPFYVNTELAEWSAGSEPRRAGVSSFGIGGTNAHVVLEEAPTAESRKDSQAPQLLVISAKTATALDQTTANLAAALKRQPNTSLADVAFTLQTGRRAFAHRRILISRELSDAMTALESCNPQRVISSVQKSDRPGVIFMFPGQGSQYVNMGRELYETQPAFRGQINCCAELLKPHLGFDLLSVLYPAAGEIDAAKERLTQTAVTQPALFVIEYALAKLWMSRGIQPSMMIGHSVGEYVAACLAGVFSLSDALALIAARGRMMQELPPGTMLAVRLSEEEVQPFLNNRISLSAVNGPKLCVLSGPQEAIEGLKGQLATRNAAFTPLQTSHAFHSAMMEPILAPFTELVRSKERHVPGIPFISNLSGRPTTADEATDPSYWASHLRRTVRFAQGLEGLLKSPENILLEVGPGHTLANLAKQHPARNADTVSLTSLPRAESETSDSETMLKALGHLWLAGVAPDWTQLHAGEQRRRVRLPTYPFERKRYWVEPPSTKPVEIPAFPNGVANGNGSNGHHEENPLNSPAPGAGSNGGNGHRIGVSPTLARLQTLIGNLSGLDAATLSDDATFAEMGFDSLFLTQASVALEKEFGVRIAFRQLLEQFPTLHALADHIDERVAPREELARPATENRVSINVQPTSVTTELTTRLSPAVCATTFTGRIGNGELHENGNGSNKTITAPLTESQRELWLASQMSDEASCVYNECRILHLRGKLQAKVLLNSLQELVNRHEALRTTFAPTGDFQKIQPKARFDVSILDWSKLDMAEQNSQLNAVQMAEARQPFDLIAGPLARARLIQMSRQHHILVMTIHHLVCDGHSFSILLQELGEIYSAESRGFSLALASPRQLSEYAQTQVEREQSPAHAADEAYWLEQFHQDAPLLELPGDHTRGAAWQYAGARVWRSLPPALGQQLKQLSARQGCTLFTTLFAAYLVLLRRLGSGNEIVVGIPMADRTIVGGETLVGHCVNFLPLRASVDANQTFEEHLAQVQKVFLDAYEHRRFAFGSLVQKVNLRRDPNRMPLVSTTFNLERVSEPLNFHGLQTQLMANAHSATSFDLNFDATEINDVLHFDCRYSTSLFSAPTIERWLGHFHTLLEEIAADERRPISQLSLLTDAQKPQILGGWAGSRTDYPREKCVHQVFEEQAAKTPDAVAVEFGETRLSYRDLNQRANQLAHHLHKLGVGRDAIVAVCAERSAELIVALLGILKAGGAYVSLDPALPPERFNFMLKDTGAPVVLTQEKFRALFSDPAGPPASSNGHSHFEHQSKPILVCLDSGQEACARENLVTPVSGATAESLAYVSFTSGSTGRPKGVCVPHRGIVRLVKDTNYASFTSETFLQFAPVAFDASTLEIWGPLLNGGRLVVFPPHTPSLAELGEFIKSHRITTLWLTAGLFHQMIEEQPDALRGLRQLLAGGDVLSVAHIRKALQHLPNCQLINGYGPTENTTFTCCHQISAASVEGRSIPIGRPIANTQVYILDDNHQPVPVGVHGELYIGGDGLARGYLNQPELTAERFLPNPFSKQTGARLYRTGDIVRWLPNGDIEFLGRTDTQVKIRGNRVELGEIESALKQYPAIRDCAVATLGSEKRLVAYIVTGEGQSPTSEALREHLQRLLPDYMVPSAFVPLEALPLNASGKVNRNALPAPMGPELNPGRTFVAPADKVEEQLAQIWEEVLEQKPIGATDNFFELGGHSLLAMRLVARIENHFGKKIPVGTVFQARTVGQMARLLREESQLPRAASIVEIQGKGFPAQWDPKLGIHVT